MRSRICLMAVVVAAFTEQIVDEGVPRALASCIADRVVADPALLDLLVTVGIAGESGPPPAILDAITACAGDAGVAIA
jgi:hypothetical protein